MTNKVRFEIERVEKTPFKEQMYTNTYAAAKAWKIEHEMKALELLKEKVTQEQYDRWLLTGMLFERSPKSGIDYIFRRLRPTLAFRELSGEKKFLAALCHHPVGYYQISWAGAMVPTDDLLSHLLTMRCDEHRLWKVSTQHAVDSYQGDF